MAKNRAEYTNRIAPASEKVGELRKFSPSFKDDTIPSLEVQCERKSQVLKIVICNGFSKLQNLATMLTGSINWAQERPTSSACIL